MKTIVTQLFLISLSLTACTSTKVVKPEETPPSLTKAEVNRIWVPDQIEGDRYITGHWTYIIKRQSVWSK